MIYFCPSERLEPSIVHVRKDNKKNRDRLLLTSTIAVLPKDK